MALFGLILSELSSVWNEVPKVFTLGQEGRKNVEFSASGTDLHNSQLLVWMLQMVFEDSKCLYIGLCRFMGGVTSFCGGGLFSDVYSFISPGDVCFLFV